MLAARTELESGQLNVVHIAKILHLLATTFDYVVVDTMPKLALSTIAALELSSTVLLITTPEVPCMQNTLMMLEALKNWHSIDGTVKLVVNNVYDTPADSPKHVDKLLSRPVFWNVPYDPFVHESVRKGMPFVRDGTDGKASRSMAGLARSLAGLPEPRTRVRMQYAIQRAAILTVIFFLSYSFGAGLNYMHGLPPAAPHIVNAAAETLPATEAPPRDDDVREAALPTNTVTTRQLVDLGFRDADKSPVSEAVAADLQDEDVQTVDRADEEESADATPAAEEETSDVEEIVEATPEPEATDAPDSEPTTTPDAEPTPTPEPLPTPTPKPQYIFYTVRYGDTLSLIARRYGLSVQTVAAVNGISSASVIYPGQRIRIPQ